MSRPPFNRNDALILFGLAAIAVGVAQFSLAIAIIVIGAIVLAIGLLGASRERRGK